MRLLLDSFWRAAAYCLHPRVIALSVLPLVLMGAVAWGLGYFYWDAAVATMQSWLEAWPLVGTVLGWTERFLGWSDMQRWIAPLLVVMVCTPLIVVLVLLLVAVMMTPSIVSLVADRRFRTLEKRHGGSLLGGVFGAAWATIAAVLALLLSIPLWLIPPLVLVLPPLIWGWLTYRVMAYDVLADHASRPERLELMREHRAPLLVLGVLTGYLGAAPALLWAWGALTIVLSPVLVPLAIWIYTLVFAFSSLWFAHYALAALELQRARVSVVDAQEAPIEPALSSGAFLERDLLPSQPLRPHEPPSLPHG